MSKSALRGGVTADLDLVDHVIGAVEYLGAVLRRPHCGRRSGLRDDLPRQRRGELKPVGADVVQGEGELPGQLRIAAQVSDDVAGELDTACSDERNRDHARQCYTCEGRDASG